MDESFDTAKRGVFAVGTLLCCSVAAFELEVKWRKLRARPEINISYFKAHECEHASGQFEKFVRDRKNISPAERELLNSISLKFISLIRYGENVTLQGLGVVQEDFYSVIADERARLILGESPYRLAYKASYLQAPWTMKYTKLRVLEDKRKKFNSSPTHKSVGFFVDECEEYGELAGPEYDELKTTHPQAREYLHTFSKGDDKEFDILQAADAWAFECRRRLNIHLGQYPGPPREQFRILDQSKKIFIVTILDKNNLRKIVEDNEPGKPLNLDKIMEMEINEDIKFRV